VLKAIVIDLEEIGAQQRWLLIFFKDVNKSKVDDCAARLDAALQKFEVCCIILVYFCRKFMELTQVSSTLRNTGVLKRVEAQLQKIHTLTLEVADKVDKIDGKVDTLVIGFGQMLKNVKETTTKVHRQEMPSKPTIFFGRDDLVNKVVEPLSSLGAASHICLLGPGGMGKTSLALAIVESPLVRSKFPKDRCVWVPCVEAATSILFMQVLSTSLGISQTDSTTTDILVELKSSQEPILLLLDNFETPWNATDGTKKQVEDTLRALTKLGHVSILVTMRASQTPMIDIPWHPVEVKSTDKEACRDTCFKINSNLRQDPHLDELLDALGCMPFAVTLMATLASESHSSAKDLLEEWYKIGPDMLSNPGSPENNMNRSISLSVDSHLVKDDPDAVHLLATLSLLPSGTTRGNLRYWAPNLGSTSRAIATLSRAALLHPSNHTHSSTSETQVLFILPVIQSYMFRQKRIQEDLQQHMRSACCEYVLHHACRYWDPNFKAYSAALAREDTNIQTILVRPIEVTSSSCDDQLVQGLLAFTWYRCNTKPLIAVAEHALKLARLNGSNRYIAEALLCLGYTYERLDRDHEAEHLLEESSELFRSLVDDHSAQKLGFECDVLRARVYRFVNGRSNDVLAVIEDVLTRTEVLDQYWYARALRELGGLRFSYKSSEGYELARETFEKATAIFLGLACRLDAAESLYRKAEVLDHMQCSDEMLLEAVQEAWEIASTFDPSHLHGNIRCLSGQILIRMGKLPDALTSFEKALGAYQHVGGAGIIADALGCIGYVYLHTGAYSDAYGAYEAAAESYASLGEDSPNGQRCKEERINMKNVRLKQENPSKKIGFYRPRTDRHVQELFFPPTL